MSNPVVKELGEVVLWKIVDSAIDLALVGMEKDLIVDQIRTKQAAGESPEQIRNWLIAERDAAIAALPKGDV